ncbi:hypothetical protein KUCAC02_020229 [Chaenocephalus aceratus]|uniref:Uncharacterized protein n=1 Tax=Chaenocephalus aceratus TaxID=36190 RepID=A0ACB9VRH5_CHAAC|nr:hypothetical protein KUCAC02_020229 [Chaenocephalus aceratus]
MDWDTLMYAISGDNDNQDNNYTKPGSSITVTYHLNNQQLKRKRGGEKSRGRILDWDSLKCSCHPSGLRSPNRIKDELSSSPARVKMSCPGRASVSSPWGT